MAGFLPAPPSFVDPKTGAPAYGTYVGSLPLVRFPARSWGAGIRDRTLRRKKWVYLAIASDEAWISLAVVRTGYAATAFAFVYDLTAKRMLLDETALAPTFAARVADDAHPRGDVASFAFGRTKLVFERAEGGLVVRARIGALDLDTTCVDAGAPVALAAIARLGDGLANATEKRALLPVRGRARVGGRELSLTDAVAGYDYTHGLLPRRTHWHWSFGLGRDTQGEPIAWNLTEGFVGEAECAAFAGARAYPLAEPRFTFGEPMSPWRLAADGIDLEFAPGAVHAQYTNLGVIRSKFVQVVGTFRGALRVDGKERALASVAGVVEDQDVLW